MPNISLLQWNIQWNRKEHQRDNAQCLRTLWELCVDVLRQRSDITWQMALKSLVWQKESLAWFLPLSTDFTSSGTHWSALASVWVRSSLHLPAVAAKTLMVMSPSSGPHPLGHFHPSHHLRVERRTPQVVATHTRIQRFRLLLCLACHHAYQKGVEG